jgi:hypothetical protein
VKGSEVDPEMSLADLALGPRDVLTVTRAAASAPKVLASPPRPAAPGYSISLLLGVVPRVGFFALPPTATLTEAEVVLRERWKLEDLDLEFALFDLETDEMAFVSKDTAIGSIDHGSHSLVVRPAQIASVGVESGFGGGGEAAAGGEPPAEARLLQSMHMTVGTVNRDVPAYQFVCDSTKAEFTLRFAVGTKVGAARSAVAARFDRRPDEVSLFFMGKALKDGFVMDRLRLGSSKITVYLPDVDPVVLLTAKGRPLH